MRLLTALAVLLIAAPVSASAQPQPRTIEVRAGAGWQHAETAMILPYKVGNLTRGSLTDRTSNERDVSVDFSGEEGLFTTVYIYRTTFPDVGVWTDRAIALTQTRKDFRPDPASASVKPFTRPGGTSAAGLITTLSVPDAQVKSTAIALTRLGSWLVKVRMTSNALDPAALELRLVRFVEGLRWPAEKAPEPVAKPVSACPEPLALKKARMIRPTMGDALINALLGSAMSDPDMPTETPSTYCRDPRGLGVHGVYRPDASRARYVIALGDAGLAIAVGSTGMEGLVSGSGKKGQVSMTLLDRNGAAALPSFNRLPPPEQALEAAMRYPPSISVSSGKGGS